MLRYHFDWTILMKAPYGQMLLDGIGTTIHLSLLAWVVALITGIAVGVCGHGGHGPLRWGAMAYVQVFRNIPA
ncbi:MAG: hypothetical protein ABIL58_10000 [Pseudomonadota bacterium]